MQNVKLDPLTGELVEGNASSTSILYSRVIAAPLVEAWQEKGAGEDISALKPYAADTKA